MNRSMPSVPLPTGLAGPVSAPAHSLPAGSPPTLGSHGVLGSVGPTHVGFLP